MIYVVLVLGPEAHCARHCAQAVVMTTVTRMMLMINSCSHLNTASLGTVKCRQVKLTSLIQDCSSTF